MDWVRVLTKRGEGNRRVAEAPTGSPMFRAIDIKRLVVIGHSRGAKLAALALAGRSVGGWLYRG